VQIAFVRRPEREHALLGPGFLLVAPGAAEHDVELVVLHRLNERLGFHDVRVMARSVGERTHGVAHAVCIHVNNQFHPGLVAHVVALLRHIARLPSRVDVQHGHWRPSWKERLAHEMQENGRVLPHRVDHHRSTTGGDAFTDDFDAL